MRESRTSEINTVTHIPDLEDGDLDRTWTGLSRDYVTLLTSSVAGKFKVSFILMRTAVL